MLKQINFTAVFSKNSYCCKGNYRPILPYTSKVIRKLLCKQITTSTKEFSPKFWCRFSFTVVTIVALRCWKNGKEIVYNRKAFWEVSKVLSEPFDYLFRKLIIANLNTCEFSHCVKSIRIRSYFVPYVPAFCRKIRIRISPDTDTFHAMSLSLQN